MAKTDATIGYYTVVEESRTGFTGGLLVLNRGGRPIEFQCTLPVRPTRAHEILFGATLRDHLLAEVIGPCLVNKTRTPISILICDQRESMRLSEFTETPIALAIETTSHRDSIDDSDFVWLAGTRLQVNIESIDAAKSICEDLNDLPDATEPFERIREAIKEAHSQIARAKMSA
jgi:hypothetical protein